MIDKFYVQPDDELEDMQLQLKRDRETGETVEDATRVAP